MAPCPGITQSERSVHLTWSEVKRHNARNDKWLVVGEDVYDITKWSKRHPGGERVISHYAGQDATDAFRAFHNDINYVKKFMKPLLVGSLSPEESKETEIDKDFRNLRQTAENMGLFKPSYFFFLLAFLHIVALDMAAYCVLLYWGVGWMPYIISILLETTAQIQTGWLQHDFGHRSVTKKRSWESAIHLFIIGLFNAASPRWWNHMHYQHHAKPNIINKDPDVRMDNLFVLGKSQPVKVAQKKKHIMPYNHQQKYFFALGPPLLVPVFFQLTIIRFIITRRAWTDLFWFLAFFVKLFYLHVPLLGVGGTILYYFIIRFVDSHWFTFVTQSNHIPMEIEEDTAEKWVPLQLHATCNIKKSYFNDWFTGHLNFQIEHHLFPTMPRHNLYKIAPLVQSLCKAHDVKYEVKELGTAFVDIYRSLKSSGELWLATYRAYHLDEDWQE